MDFIFIYLISQKSLIKCVIYYVFYFNTLSIIVLKDYFALQKIYTEYTALYKRHNQDIGESLLKQLCTECLGLVITLDGWEV